MRPPTAPRPAGPRLSDEAVRRAMHLSVPEGALWALMVGASEAWFVADAVRLGATPLVLALLVTLPLAGGAVGSALAVVLMSRLRRRKTVVLLGVAVQLLVLTTLALLHGLGRVDAASLIALSFLQQMGGQFAGPAWASWFGDLVPREVRGRYFARRSRFVHLATFVSLALSGLVLQSVEPGAPGEVATGAGGEGYVVLFLVAAGARALSALLLILSPEPPAHALPGPGPARRFLATRRGRAAWRLLALAGSLQALVYVAAPYFGPHMFEGLRFTYVEYTLASGALVGAKIAALAAWGNAVDLYGARPVLVLAAVLVAVVPLPWLWATGLGWVLFAQALSGFSWGGHEVGYFSLVLETTTKRVRVYVFAAQNAVHALGQVLGGLAGAALLEASGHDVRVVFAASALGRLAVAAVLPRLVPAIGRQPPVGRRDLLLRVVGLRPHGGLVHRPLAAPDPPSPAGDASRAR